ncbi:MAG: branched-chain amino acid transport system ATP-binding protein [Rhodocyclaceae bacterium]|jgi:branched-chain amino acid transport system ATP-binding protein|nr:MAG: branched-chain amino acid transport system ATP-binding protein [Rhodocyclaceae bacterium]TND04234.1 MAG: branched-chain amino acid transport system ATP-binding protein [Rhodocyclaceae bacterium]
MKPTLLETQDLCVNYGRVEAIHKVSIRIREGDIVTVIGPNGAGKTTLLSALMGLLPARGEVAYQGQPTLGKVSVDGLVGKGLVLVPEKRELFGSMSVADNLLLGAFARHRRGARDHARTMEEVFAIFPRLAERRAQEAGTLSGGERQMLAMGRALMAKPTLLMLDEPSLGLAPLIVKEIFRIVVQLKDMGVSVLLVEQNARAALQVADYGYVLENGSVALESDARTLLNDPRVIESYLGLGGSHSIAA